MIAEACSVSLFWYDIWNIYSAEQNNLTVEKTSILKHILLRFKKLLKFENLGLPK